MVKVGGFDREVVRDASRPFVVPANDDREGNVNDNYGVTQSDEVSPSPGKSSGETEGGIDIFEHFGAKGG